MFYQTWRKYLPVIRILLKRSANSEQALDMNQSDFERATGGKKVKFTFSITLANGRLVRNEAIPMVATDLIAVLQQDDAANELLGKREIELVLTNNFQLVIKTPTSLPPTILANETMSATKNSGTSDK